MGSARSVFLLLSSIPLFTVFCQGVYAHLDPPAPPAFLERIWILSVTINNDGDLVGAGEIFAEIGVTPAAPHGAEGAVVRHPPLGAVPNWFALAAPPPAALPMPAPAGMLQVLWLPNCDPIEAPHAMDIHVWDIDVIGNGLVFVAAVAPVAPGINVVVTPAGSFTYLYATVPMPAWNDDCDDLIKHGDDEHGGVAVLTPGATFMKPAATKSFVYKFTNTQDLADTFFFQVSPANLAVQRAQLNRKTLVAVPQPADPAWFTWERPEVTSGIHLARLQSIKAKLLVRIPPETPPGFYAFIVDAQSHPRGFLGGPEQQLGLIEVGPRPTIRR
jgi:hypothetical protein